MEFQTPPLTLCKIPSVMKGNSLSCKVLINESYCEISYEFSTQFSRPKTSLLFIPKFLEKHDYLVYCKEKRQSFIHTPEGSSLFATGPHSGSIQVRLYDATIHGSGVSARYRGQDFSGIPVLNSLVEKIMEMYAKK